MTEPIVKNGQPELDLSRVMQDLDGTPFNENGAELSLGVYLRGALGRNRSEQDLISIMFVALRIDEAMKNGNKIVIDGANLEMVKRVIKADSYQTQSGLIPLPAALRGRAMMMVEGK